MATAFTYMDHVNGSCTVEEIGTNWTPRWSRSDMVMGACDAAMVGTAKPVAESTAPPAPPMTTARRKSLLTGLMDGLLEQAHDDPGSVDKAMLIKLVAIAEKLLDNEDRKPQVIPFYDQLKITTTHELMVALAKTHEEQIKPDCVDAWRADMYRLLTQHVTDTDRRYAAKAEMRALLDAVAAKQRN